MRLRVKQQVKIPLDASFECPPGKTLALVGPSGSGKSTLLRCIAGLYRAADGHIACAGDVWFDASAGVDRQPQQRSVGIVFQSYALFPHLSALDNVVAALGRRPARDREARGRELLARVHLSGLESRRPAQLSGGQQQRVAMARALARDPQVLLLDEPFSAVDRVTRQKLYRELAELRRSLALPIVLVTHDLDEAAMLADRMCLLHRGRTLQTGAPLEVMTRPADVEVARIVDMKNVFEGRIVAGDNGRARLAWAGHSLEVDSTAGYGCGTRVCWGIPMSGVLLHRRDRPSRGERENPVEGFVAECVPLGEDTTLTMRVDGAATALWVRVPTHVAERNGVRAGERIGVSLLAEMIHLMPWRDLTPDAGV